MQNNVQSKTYVTHSIEQNENLLKGIIKETIDIVYYKFKTPGKKEYLLVYFDDIINKEILDRDVVGALIAGSMNVGSSGDITAEGLKSGIHFSNIKLCSDIDTVVEKVLGGDVILFAKGLNTALCLPSQGWQQRGIIEPEAEIITKGPREGFVETLKTNRAMIRRKLQNPNLNF